MQLDLIYKTRIKETVDVPIEYPAVQQQKGGKDCGVIAAYHAGIVVINLEYNTFIVLFPNNISKW